MKTLTIGGATQDVFIHHNKNETSMVVDEQDQCSYLVLREGAKIEIDKLTYATGGGATNSAVSFQRLGCETSVCCMIGKDSQASFMLKNLEQENIQTTFVHETDEACTGISFILPTTNKDRIIFAYRGANAYLNKEHIPFNNFKQFQNIYITSLSGSSASLLLPITKKAKKLNLFVANNPGKSQLAAGADVVCKSLPYIDVFILNAHEASELMLSLSQTDEVLAKKVSKEKELKTENNLPALLHPIRYKNIHFTLSQYMHEILKRGPKIAVVTNGAEGVYVGANNTIYFHPSLETDIQNTTLGAGDAFGSCFAAMLAQGNGVPEALVKGIINACSVIGQENAKDGLLTANVLEKLYKEIGVAALQTFERINQ